MFGFHIESHFKYGGEVMGICVAEKGSIVVLNSRLLKLDKISLAANYKRLEILNHVDYL